MNVQITPTQARLMREHRERQRRIFPPKPVFKLKVVAIPEPIIPPAPPKAIVPQSFKDAWAMIDAANIENTIEPVIRASCRYFSMTRQQLMSRRQTPKIARPRQVAMYVCKEVTGCSLPQIGRKFDGRDHTTVLHAWRRINKMQDTDASIRAAIDGIKAILAPVHNL